MVRVEINAASLALVRGDITRERVDAIVNAANERLMGGGGVDGAIHRAGGPAIAAECSGIRARQGGCPTGKAVITSGGNLQARHVIHTVGPVWRGGSAGEAELLAGCYRESLGLAVGHGLRTIAFPLDQHGGVRIPAGRGRDRRSRHGEAIPPNQRRHRRGPFRPLQRRRFPLFFGSPREDGFVRRHQRSQGNIIWGERGESRLNRTASASRGPGTGHSAAARELSPLTGRPFVPGATSVRSKPDRQPGFSPQSVPALSVGLSAPGALAGRTRGPLRNLPSQV